MTAGHLIVQLHAHLPYVRHPEEPVFLEESWLFEAITEVYIPLLERLDRMLRTGVQARLCMTWSPSLCEMLADPLLQQRYRHHLTSLLDLAGKEEFWKRNTPFHPAALMYRDHFQYCLSRWDALGGNILTWVKDLMDAGVLEVVTCGATHGYLPLMSSDAARRAQLAVACNNYRKHFGRSPRGIWLPECAFAPGIDRLLSEQQLEFFFVETHAVYYGAPRPRYGSYAPVFTPAGVAAFARDPETSRSVWSSQTGYPGNPVYREFYRDLGYDGDYNYVKPYLHPDGVRRNLGLKYHRITGKVQLHEKLPYDPAIAHKQAMDDAGHFLDARAKQCRHLTKLLGKPACITSPYDAELFGHWWFEGPQFIESLFHAAASHPDIEVLTPSEYLDRFPCHQIVMPNQGSWGENGFHGVWLNPANDWIYRHLHAAEDRMRECALRHPMAPPLLTRFLNQMARELLLMQSSDWAFIMTTGTAGAYATRRVRDHVHRFTGLYEQVMRGDLNAGSLATIEGLDPIFQEIDYRVYI